MSQQLELDINRPPWHETNSQFKTMNILTVNPAKKIAGDDLSMHQRDNRRDDVVTSKYNSQQTKDF